MEEMVITLFRVVALAALTGLLVLPPASAQQTVDPWPVDAAPRSARLDEAHHLFYSGRYEASAALALEIRTADSGNLDASELRTSALHFQIRRALGEPKDRDKAWKACVVCQELMPVFLEELAVGQAEARARLMRNPVDDEAQFFLGKLDLNYVWLQLATIGRKTGWKEYWEARKSLDALLKIDPKHVRARVARGWIDYIVNTRMPWGTRWILGGGNKKKGLAMIREAAASETDPFSHAEAEFALWDILLRDKNEKDAIEVAGRIAKAFPENGEVAAFLAARAGK